MEQQTTKKPGKGSGYGRTKITRKKFMLALDGSNGIVMVIAQRLNCSREAVTKYIQRNPDVKDSLQNERDKILDVGENKFFTLVNSGNLKAIEFLLRTLGRDRGYITKQEIETIAPEADPCRERLDKIS